MPPYLKRPVVRQRANSHLRATAASRMLDTDLSPDAIADYLDGAVAVQHRGLGNFWSRTRIASTALKIRWSFTFTDGQLVPTLFIPSPSGDKIVRSRQRHAVLRHHRQANQAFHLETWKNQKDQGRSAHDLSRAGNKSSHFVRTGAHLRWSDYFVVHHARFNLLRGVRAGFPWADSEDDGCRYGCLKNDQPRKETQAHVLNHCRHNYGVMLKRHNAIVDMVKGASSAMKWRIITEDERFGTEDRRPDLVLANRQGTIYKILDVAVAFEGKPGALEAARKKKISKYQNVLAETRAIEGVRSAAVVPIVVGSRGAWDPKNDALLRDLVHPDYLPELRRMVSAAIRGSHDVYKHHFS